jgi:hypothetical protein
VAAGRDGADDEPGDASGELTEATRLVVERATPRGGELVERLDGQVERAAGAVLVPDAGDAAVHDGARGSCRPGRSGSARARLLGRGTSARDWEATA